MSAPDFARAIALDRPARILFGPGLISRVGAFGATRDARRTLVVTAPFLRERVGELGLAGEVVTFDGVTAEPDTAMLTTARQLADDVRPDLIVGLGGGSAMDLAKLLAVLVGTTLEIADVVGVDRVPRRAVALAQVPTTAGTGSEAGPRALVSDHATGGKLAVESQEMMADLAVIDPELARTVPPELTAETGIDALAHCVEAFTNVRAHPAVDLYAREGIRLVGRYLRRAVANGDDLEARGGLALAALYGGYCLGPVNTAAGHAIAYPLSTRHGLGHGRANAIIFPHVLAHNASAVPERTQEVCELLGFGGVGENALFEAASAFCRDLGIAMRLSEHGIGVDDLAPMVSEASAIRRLLDNNPRPFSPAEIADIYRAAL